jgi:hypothetical protein
MNCPKCGAEIETLVVNVRDGSEGCWPVSLVLCAWVHYARHERRKALCHHRADIWIIDY